MHVIYGLSKDFCASGLRVGVLHTRNEGIHNALNNLSYFGAVSNLAQWTIATVLADLPWVQSFLGEGDGPESLRRDDGCDVAGDAIDVARVLRAQRVRVSTSGERGTC